MLGEVRTGIHTDLEKQANELLRQSREGVTALSEKKDFFTEDQMKLRYDKEVYNINGYPDPHICSGLYRRSYNPNAGQRPVGRRHSEEY